MSHASYRRSACCCLLFAILPPLSQSAIAASASACHAALRDLVVPALHETAMKKEDIQVELDDATEGVYSVKLFVAADSPDNLDKRVTVGWVNLDVGKMKVFDVTDDPDNPVSLNVSTSKYRRYVDRCLHGWR